MYRSRIARLESIEFIEILKPLFRDTNWLCAVWLWFCLAALMGLSSPPLSVSSSECQEVINVRNVVIFLILLNRKTCYFYLFYVCRYMRTY